MLALPTALLLGNVSSNSTAQYGNAYERSVECSCEGEGHMLIRAPCGSVKDKSVIHMNFKIQFAKTPKGSS